MVRTDTWLGSGASVTFIPEADLRYTTKYDKDSTSTGTWVYSGSTSGGFNNISTGNLIKIELSVTCQNTYSDLVPDLYQGCTLDIYESGSYTNSYRVKYNDLNSFYIEAAEADIADLTNNGTDYFLIKGGLWLFFKF